MTKLVLLMIAMGSLLSACVVYDTPDRDGGVRHVERDRDHDGVPNRDDRDRDGDGVPNRRDRRPDDPRRD
jgi:hypothetical protein